MTTTSSSRPPQDQTTVPTDTETEITLAVPAVLFADLSGWTDLTSRVGDEAALAVRDALFVPLKIIIGRNNGWLVKTLGDELMCLFQSAADAARAALQMQRHAERANRSAREALPLRIGIHAGAVITKDQDIEGNTVNVAARVVAASRPERILMTRVTAQRLTEDLSRLLRTWRTEALKGKTETFELLELNWREATEQRTIAGHQAVSDISRLYTRLKLSCQGNTLELKAGGKPLTFGRSPHNELVIDDKLAYVSGSHGKIEVSGAGMLLTDNSRNGIYISFGNGRYFLVEKTLLLRGSGRMSLGRAPDDPGAIFAEFDLE